MNPARVAEDPAVRVAGLLALAAFLLFLISGRSVDLLGSTPRMGLVLAWGAVAAAFWITRRPSIVVAYLVLGGLLLRWVELPDAGRGPSDVLAAIDEALEVWFGGGNPYDHDYLRTRPPGQPMPYPPGALLLHLPGQLLGGLPGIQATQLALAGVTMASLAWLGARLGWVLGLPALALYAGAPNLVLLATDGSNDTGTGALLLLAVLALAWAIDRGADPAGIAFAGMVAAFALSTKQLALPIGLALVVYLARTAGWRPAGRYLLAAGALLLLISIPFLLQGPVTYVAGLLSFLGVHDDVYGWNIWAFGQGLGIAPWEAGPAAILNVASSLGALGALVLLPLRSMAGAVLAGVVVLLVMMLTARWTTYAYFALLAPLVLALPALAAWDAGRRSAPA
ncbi:MAG: hypothetical protein ACRDHD_07875 [Candidatus Limnocylindria bacterium]